MSWKVFQHPALDNSKKAVDKAGHFEMRPKLWIRRELVANIVKWAKKHSDRQGFAMLFLCSYIFLLRLPSEALPIKIQKGEFLDGQAVLKTTGDKLILSLARRKNKENGSVLERGEISLWCFVPMRSRIVKAAGAHSAKKLAQSTFWGRGLRNTNMGMRYLMVRVCLDVIVFFVGMIVL